jgi:uncharacterized protein (DUF1697 family)
MPVIISMLRGVNLARHRRMKMEDLRALYESMRLTDVRTYVQSVEMMTGMGSAL